MTVSASLPSSTVRNTERCRSGAIAVCTCMSVSAAHKHFVVHLHDHTSHTYKHSTEYTASLAHDWREQDTSWVELLWYYIERGYIMLDRGEIRPTSLICACDLAGLRPMDLNQAVLILPC